MSSFSTILNLLTAGFLLDSATAPPTAAALLDAIEIHSKTFSTLSASLATASFEVYDSRSRGYSDIVAGIIRLAQGLIGLRGSFRNEEGDSEDDVDFKSRIEVPLRDLTQRIQDLLQALMLDAPTSPNPFTDLHRLRAELSLSLETFRTAYASAIRSVALRLPVSTPNGVIPDPFIDTSKLDGHVSVDESMFKKYYYYGAQLNAWVGELLNLVDAFTKSKKVKRSGTLLQIQQIFLELNPCCFRSPTYSIQDRIPFPLSRRTLHLVTSITPIRFMELVDQVQDLGYLVEFSRATDQIRDENWIRCSHSSDSCFYRTMARRVVAMEGRMVND